MPHFSSLCLFVLCITSILNIDAQFIEGSTQKCETEGEEVYIPHISDDPCITCICKNKEVTCVREKCPRLEGCHMILFDKPDDQCCAACKGCLHRGKMYPSGAEWDDPFDPCNRFACQAGVLVKSKAECLVPCKYPVQHPGKCCPVCEGCSFQNRSLLNGEDFPSPSDPCTICKCKDGSIECKKHACPVLNCPSNKQFTPEGECCPICKGSRNVFDLQRRACLFENRIYPNSTDTTPDSCTDCVCVDGTMMCDRKVCPILDCASKETVLDEGACCPRCKKTKKQCKLRGKQYPHGSNWLRDTCTSCHCEAGLIRCQSQQCSNEVECPKNSKLQQVPGQCCPACVEEEAVCAVFGDPHYRTFDGRIYNFQGTCNYVLAEDCGNSNQTFSVRVRNDGRVTNDFAWTKSVAIAIGQDRIHLYQKLRIKVNQDRVELPYESGSFKIIQGGHSVTMTTRFGVKLVWDGNSYLEISIPPTFKNQMCGLCGNYNNLEADDFLGKDGQLYLDANHFAETWKSSDKKKCKKPSKKKGKNQSEHVCKKKAKRQRAEEECSLLKSDVFLACRDKVDVEPYHTSCLTDMCDCPKKRECSCESLTAYERACSHAGVQVKWRTPSLCGEPDCPRKSSWNICASDCPVTCENYTEPSTCSKPCVAACQCHPGTVLHRNRCIKPEKCPKNRRKKVRQSS